MGIIHRDIKLDNLFIQKGGPLKVLDFGVARLRDSAKKGVQTRAGAMLGTLPYMPPEQVRGQDIDARADLFAVGATMFRLVARKRIHDASTESEMLVKMATLPAPPLASVVKDAAASLCLVVDRALAFRREERYPSAKQMQEDVRALRRGDPPAYAMARLAGSLPGDPEPSLRSPQLQPQLPPEAQGRNSYGDLPTVVPGAKAAAHAATVALSAVEDLAGAASSQAPSGPKPADRAQEAKATTASGTLLMSQQSFSGRGLPSADASMGPPSASASTLVSVLSDRASSPDRPAASIRVTSAPAMPAAPSPRNGNPASSDARAELGPAHAMDLQTTLGAGQSLSRAAARDRMTQVLLVVLFAGIAALAMVAGGLWWYFRNESSGQQATPAGVPSISSTAVSTEPVKPQPRNDVSTVATTPSPDPSAKKKPGQWRVQDH
jgi:serine/threonine-protein kinase